MFPRREATDRMFLIVFEHITGGSTHDRSGEFAGHLMADDPTADSGGLHEKPLRVIQHVVRPLIGSVVTSGESSASERTPLRSRSTAIRP